MSERTGFYSARDRLFRPAANAINLRVAYHSVNHYFHEVKAIAKPNNKVVLLTEKGRKVATLDGESALKLAHELMDVAEQALQKAECVHEP